MWLFPGKRIILGCCFAILLAGAILSGADNPKTPRELIQYIEDARRLGLKESEIQKNAVTAGWDKTMVGEAMAIVRYLNESPPKGTAAGANRTAVPPEGYRIGSGDVLQIVVWKEPDATVPSVVVRADGKITVPLIKEIEVAGMTPVELEKVLVEKLGRFIKGVDVTVVPKEIKSQKVYLVGAVRAEGPIPIDSSKTVLQALNAGGGLTDYAKRSKIYILRKENGKQVRIPFDYKAVIKGEKTDQNILVKPDDTIVVP